MMAANEEMVERYYELAYKTNKTKLMALKVKLMKSILIRAHEKGTSDDSYRICDICGDIMDQGYCVDNGMEYYCSEKCLHTVMTDEEWYELSDGDNSDSYWTHWY